MSVCVLQSCEHLPPCRAALASAHQGQPLPKTLSVLESTPQVRGMHTIIRYIPAPGPCPSPCLVAAHHKAWCEFLPFALGLQSWGLAWSRMAEWSWPWPCGHFSGDQSSAHLLWVIPEPKASFSYSGRGLVGSLLTGTQVEQLVAWSKVPLAPLPGHLGLELA